MSRSNGQRGFARHSHRSAPQHLAPEARRPACDKYHPGVESNIVQRLDDDGAVLWRTCRVCQSVREKLRPKRVYVPKPKKYGFAQLNWTPPEFLL